MFRITIISVVLIVVSFVSATHAQQNPLSRKRPEDAQGNVQKFALQQLRDPMVNDVVALTTMVPQGWQMQGKVHWLPNFSVASNLELVIADPQTGFSIQWLPTQSFTFVPNPPVAMEQGTNYMGRIFVQPIADPAQFVQWFYAQSLPHLRNAKFIAGEDFPNQARYYQNQMQTQGQKHVRTVRMRYQFDAPNGQPWEEDVYLTLSFSSDPALVLWDAFAAYSVRGPKGSLDQRAPLVRAVLNSTQFTPDWLAARNVVQQLFTQRLKIDIENTREFGRKLAEYREYTANLSKQISEDRMRSNDARNEAFRETLGGVENYRDPYQSQPVYLPAGYKEYWSNAKGEYVLSDEWGYNPNVGDTTEWKKIERIDPMGR